MKQGGRGGATETIGGGREGGFTLYGHTGGKSLKGEKRGGRTPQTVTQQKKVNRRGKTRGINPELRRWFSKKDKRKKGGSWGKQKRNT